MSEQHPSSIWPEISNPLARQLVRQVWDLVPNIPLQRTGEYLNTDLPHKLFLFRDQLRERLRSSGIAQRLIDGPAAFPDIMEQVHTLLRPLAAMSKPRNHGEMARYILRHLDWYLDPTSIPRKSFQEHSRSIFLLGLVGAILPALGLLIGGDATIPLVLTGFLFLIPMLLLISPDVRSSEWQRRWSQEIESIKLVEFYYYLHETYTDMVDEPQMSDTSQLSALSHRDFEGRKVDIDREKSNRRVLE